MAGPTRRPPDLTALARRHIHQSVALKFGALYQGLTAEKQRAMVAFLEQAVHLAEHSGFSRFGDGIGALLYGAQRVTQTVTE